MCSMRWDDLTVEEQDARTLPGYKDPAVVRTFDAPEALDTNFYEVRAKTVINRVPEQSQVPFRWTINPYRGCTHACTYCASGDTQILMADGRHKPLEDLRVGDEIVGTEWRGSYRHYVPTVVLDRWSSIKPAYRVTLADGTELVASGDHRFLSDRGWKHVTGTEQGRNRRPHLTLANKLIGTGQFAKQPVHSPDYRRGYLCGLIRGDGTIGVREYVTKGGRPWTHHSFRLALTDFKALRRAREFLLDDGIRTKEFAFAAANDRHRAIRAIRTQSRPNVERITALLRWPLSPTDDWRKGFLAGIFDAEGSCGGQALRISNCDSMILKWTAECLAHFGFDVVLESTKNANGLKVVRIRGGLRERLRFFHLTDPAITRKRTVEGMALKSDADLRVVSIERLGIAMRLYDITTGTGDFIANGVVSHNCFARPSHKYLDFNAGRDFEKEIVVKVNAPEVLRAQLAKPSWKGEHIALGTNTDPYQWVEGRYKLMRGIWEAMRDAANPCSILTKSPLLLRDLDLMQEIAERTSISANLSIPTLDEKAWRETEPHTPSPRARIEAVRKLNEAGIPTGVLIAPLMPGINDSPEQVEEIVRLSEEAGAVSIGGIALHLRGEVRNVFMGWLRSKRPDLVPQYEQMYRRGAYAPKDFRDRVAKLTRTTSNWPRRYIRDRAEFASREREAREPEPAAPAQPSLF
jgi:DNA repair photolyase